MTVKSFTTSRITIKILKFNISILNVVDVYEADTTWPLYKGILYYDEVTNLLASRLIYSLGIDHITDWFKQYSFPFWPHPVCSVITANYKNKQQFTVKFSWYLICILFIPGSKSSVERKTVIQVVLVNLALKKLEQLKYGPVTYSYL